MKPSAMAIARDIAITLVFCTLAAWLPSRFLDYKGIAVQDQRGTILEPHGPPGLVIATDTKTLNITDTVLENGQMTAHPGAILIQNGFYAHTGYSVVEAIAGGLAVPALLMIGAAYFVARAKRASRQWDKARARVK
jgi:hypothetical protein